MIRDALEQDGEQLTILIEELGYSISLQEMKQRLSLIFSNPSYQTYVYEIDNRLGGMIGMQLSYSYERGNHVRVIALVVHSDYRGKGIGGKLLKKSRELGRKTGCEYYYIK